MTFSLTIYEFGNKLEIKIISCMYRVYYFKIISCMYRVYYFKIISCMYRVYYFKFVNVSIYTKHDVFVYRVPISILDGCLRQSISRRGRTLSNVFEPNTKLSCVLIKNFKKFRAWTGETELHYQRRS